MIFSAMPTPSYETFETVSIGATVRLPDLTGAVHVDEEVPVDEARAFAQQILDACKTVERDKEASHA